MGAQKGNRNATLQEQDSKDRYDSTRAIAQLEDHKRKQESKAKEKAKKIRKTGRVPVKCFCFKSL